MIQLIASVITAVAIIGVSIVVIGALCAVVYSLSIPFATVLEN